MSACLDLRSPRQSLHLGEPIELVATDPSATASRENPLRTLLLATSNPHKLEEFCALFSDLPWRLLSLKDLQLDTEVEEMGTTFAQNAELKARAYAHVSGMLSLADDSGLVIDALGGAPVKRAARFRCAIALAEPSGYTRIVDGVIEGVIADSPRGEHGFGYDPIFLLPELGKTLAELAPELKNRISHRARAAQSARKLLEDWPYL